MAAGYVGEQTVERITAAHYADQLEAGIVRLHELIDRMDGGVPTVGSVGVPTPPYAGQYAGLIGAFESAVVRIEAANSRLTEVTERLGRAI